MHTALSSSLPQARGPVGREGDASGMPHGAQRDAFGVSRPLLLWAVVLAVTMLSFYVHLLNEQMLRAQAPRALPTQGTLQAKARPPLVAKAARSGAGVERLAAAH